MLHATGQTALYPALPPLTGSEITTGDILDLMGPLDQAHLLLIGPGMLDLMCDAIRHGCLSAAAVCSHDLLQPDCVDLVYVSGGVDPIALAHILRTLLPGGRVILRIDSEAQAARILPALLTLGFVNARLTSVESARFVLAERLGARINHA